MGTAEADLQQGLILIRSHIVTYGASAGSQVTDQICREIESMWNEPLTEISVHNRVLRVRFRITGEYAPHLQPDDVYYNTDPGINYFRIENKAPGNISFVDGLGCNTGYFLLENLYEGSTTAAHEYGHTLGLPHPSSLDYREQGIPPIMCPRGTLVDAEFQYNPVAIAGDNTNGGTMHPRYRRVKSADIKALKLHRKVSLHETVVVGDFSSVWHDSYA